MGRGRPRTSPRLLLDAIFWKLATGQTWEALPHGFPPQRLCQKYYRRLFLSGRLYTLLLALYNHLRLESSTGLPELLEAGVFTTTPSQKIALSPDAPPTWENYTALLFMQLARSAYSHLERNYKQAHPLYTLLPNFKGVAALSTGRLPALPAPLPQVPVGTIEGPGLSSPLSKSARVPVGEGFGEGFQPLENSPAWKEWRKIERTQKTIAREVSKRLRAAGPPASDDSISSFLDEELEP